MASFSFTNVSGGPVLLRLNSGVTLHLAPGEVSRELEGADVLGNARLEPLLQRRLLHLEEVPGSSTGRRPSSRSASRSKRTKRDADSADEGAES